MLHVYYLIFKCMQNGVIGVSNCRIGICFWIIACAVFELQVSLLYSRYVFLDCRRLVLNCKSLYLASMSLISIIRACFWIEYVCFYIVGVCF